MAKAKPTVQGGKMLNQPGPSPSGMRGGGASGGLGGQGMPSRESFNMAMSVP